MVFSMTGTSIKTFLRVTESVKGGTTKRRERQEEARSQVDPLQGGTDARVPRRVRWRKSVAALASRACGRPGIAGLHPVTGRALRGPLNGFPEALVGALRRRNGGDRGRGGHPASPLDGPSRRQPIRGSCRRPTTVPRPCNIGLDSERVWGPTGDADDPTDIVTPDGDYMGTLPPDGLRTPNAFGPGRLMAYIERGDLDVPIVRVVRLVALAPAGESGM